MHQVFVSIFSSSPTNLVQTFKVFGISMEERVLMQEFLASKIYSKYFQNNKF